MMLDMSAIRMIVEGNFISMISGLVVLKVESWQEHSVSVSVLVTVMYIYTREIIYHFMIIVLTKRLSF